MIGADLTIREAAGYLGLKVRTIRKWVSMGTIKAKKRGKCWYIPMEELTREETLNRANKGREHSKRIKEGIELGMLARRGQDSKESPHREECKKQ